MDPVESQVLAAGEGGCNSRFGLAIPKQVRAEKLSLLFSGNKERLLALQTENVVPEDKTRALRKAGGGGRAWALPQATLLIRHPGPYSRKQQWKDIGNFDMEEIAFFCRKEEFCFEDKKPLALTKCLIRR